MKVSNLGALLLSMTLFGVMLPGQSQAAKDVMIVYDASGSMWGQIDGVTKIEIARDVMADMVERWPADTRIGLVTYGHRRDRDCKDIETLVTPGALNKSRFIDTVNRITPKGRTPLSAAVEHAASELSYRENPATVVLISDGIENCQADPCAMAARLAEQGVDFKVHVIGFDIDSKAHNQLACIAKNTGGQFLAASDAAELQQALLDVQSVIQAETELPKRSESEAVSAPAPVPVEVRAPQAVIAGSLFDVSWSPTVEPNDYIGIVAKEAREGSLGNYTRARDATSAQLTAPAKAGGYEVRYVLNKGRATAGSTLVEVVDPEVTLIAPERVIAGERFDVSWSASINPADRVAIVPVDAQEGQLGNYLRVRDKLAGALTAPSRPGQYAVRYVLNEGRKTIASVPIEVSEGVVTLTAPQQVSTGQRFTAGWSKVINQDDFVGIVPVGAKEGMLDNHIRVRTSEQGQLTAPSQPGAYELRYILQEGRKTIGRLPVAVVQAEVTIDAPVKVDSGQRFTVNWSATINPDDFIAIVPVGTKEGELGSQRNRVREHTKGDLTAPAQPGMYEVRYVLNEGRKTMARAAVEVVESTLSVTAPKSVTAGQRFDVQWSATINPDDFIAIVPVGTKEGELGSQRNRVRQNTKADLTAPAQPGTYEVRYVLNEGRKTLASSPVEVTVPQVSIEGPAAQVRAGSRISASWSSTINQNDFIVIVPMGAEDSHRGITRTRVRGATQVQMTAPEVPGIYEMRYVLAEGNRVLARDAFEVVGKDAPLSHGVVLNAPDTAGAGQTVNISWSGAEQGGNHRVSLAGRDQAAFTWIKAEPVSSATSLEMTLPAEPGQYEIRFLDVDAGKVLARRVIEVK